MNQEITKELYIDILKEATGIDFTNYKKYVYELREDHGSVEHVHIGFKMSLSSKPECELFRELVGKYKPVEVLAGDYDEKTIMLGFAKQNPGHFSEPNHSFAVYSKYVNIKE